MTDPQQRHRRGCLFYGGLAAVVVAVALFGVYFGFRYAKGVINQLTDTKPMPLPSTHLPQVQMFELKDRIETFEDSIRDGVPTDPLQLSGDEVNSLIATEPSFAALKNHLYVTIDGDQLHAQVSFPAEDLGLDALRGRYINASGVFDVGITNDQLRITAESLTAKGKPVARHVMRRIAAQNLAAKFNEDPQAAEALKNLRAVEVKDGKLVISAKK
jgi:hypothetical protein